ncbi:MAG: polysaccharide deacetylase family protein [Thermoleophilaceae bacterium]|nr:polysaccharide deacetylase family protein [Thermoleophilaceae bacterium]
MAALTFDDGPDPVWTPRVLDALAAAGVRATFFVMARRVLRHTHLVERMVGEGHEVELHCLDHIRHDRMFRGRLERDTDLALSMLGELDLRPRRWRPPWGVTTRSTEQVARLRGLVLAGWTLDTEDWAGHSAAHMLDRAGPGLRSDPVVLMHDSCGPGARRDGCTQTVALIEQLAAALAAAGQDVRPLNDRPVAVPWPR